MAARVCCFCLAKHFTRNLKFVTQGSLSARPDICRNTLLLLDICVYDRRYISSGVETARVGARERRVAPPVACPTPRWNGAALRGIPFINSGVTALNLRNFTATDLRKTSGGHNTDQKRQKFGAFKEIREDIVTIPNLLSALRIVAAPVLAYLIISEYYVTATVLFGAAGITDLLDGYIARNFKNQKSVFGTALDPLSDKILISTLIISLTAVSLLPVPLTTLILSRDVVLVVSAFYFRYKSLPPPRTVSRYFDFNLPTVELRPTFISKVNTALQLALVGCTMLAPIFHYVDHPYIQAFWYVVAGSTALSGASYAFSKSSVRYLK